MEGPTAGTGARPGERPGAHRRIPRSAPEVSVAARLAHLQCAAGNAAVLRLLGRGPAAGDEAPGTPDPAP